MTTTKATNVEEQDTNQPDQGQQAQDDAADQHQGTDPEPVAQAAKKETEQSEQDGQEVGRQPTEGTPGQTAPEGIQADQPQEPEEEQGPAGESGPPHDFGKEPDDSSQDEGTDDDEAQPDNYTDANSDADSNAQGEALIVVSDVIGGDSYSQPQDDGDGQDLEGSQPDDGDGIFSAFSAVPDDEDGEDADSEPDDDGLFRPIADGQRGEIAFLNNPSPIPVVVGVDGDVDVGQDVDLMGGQDLVEEQDYSVAGDEKVIVADSVEPMAATAAERVDLAPEPEVIEQDTMDGQDDAVMVPVVPDDGQQDVQVAVLAEQTEQPQEEVQETYQDAHQTNQQEGQQPQGQVPAARRAAGGTSPRPRPRHRKQQSQQDPELTQAAQKLGTAGGKVSAAKRKSRRLGAPKLVMPKVGQGRPRAKRRPWWFRPPTLPGKK